MHRLVAVGARGSGMATQFACGLLLTAVGAPAEAAAFFVTTASVSLLVAILGLELHTYSDREVAHGMSPFVALRGIARMQVAWLAVATLVILVLHETFGWTAQTAALVIANAILGLGLQECFRLLVVLGAQTIANLTIVARNTGPFLVACGALVAGRDLTADAVLALWLIGGVVALPLALLALRSRATGGGGRPFSTRDAWRTASRYFPIAVVARSMFSLDVVVLATFATPEFIALYGNGANLAAAFFTLGDLAVVQWRMREMLRQSGGAINRQRVLKESAIVASIAGVVGAGYVVVAQQWGSLEGSSLTVALSLVAVSSIAAIMMQSLQLTLYSQRRDGLLLSSYLVASAVFGTTMAVAIAYSNEVLVAAARAAGWTALCVMIAVAIRPRARKEL